LLDSETVVLTFRPAVVSNQQNQSEIDETSGFSKASSPRLRRPWEETPPSRLDGYHNSEQRGFFDLAERENHFLRTTDGAANASMTLGFQPMCSADLIKVGRDPFARGVPFCGIMYETLVSQI
jgi:hypothetical protein